MAANSQSAEEFVAERDAALASLDWDYARKFMPNITDAVRLIAMHKARYEAVRVDPALRHESRRWLSERGYKRLIGTELLPQGELPE